ncbi:hypothetical protein U9M48_044096 [Paspalum notatum var. saurae]|uniref:Uncharacterized protein n=1 Tax=Paspalum notatum var. saurae TaxID=547442 RepID=A0AAQ3XI07_PASNO
MDTRTSPEVALNPKFRVPDNSDSGSDTEIQKGGLTYIAQFLRCWCRPSLVSAGEAASRWRRAACRQWHGRRGGGLGPGSCSCSRGGRGRPCSMRRRAAGQAEARSGGGAGRQQRLAWCLVETRQSAGRPESRTGGGAEPQDGRTAGAAGGGYVPMLCLCVAFV